MTESERSPKDQDVQTSPNPVQPPDANNDDGESFADAEAAEEAREEAEKLDAVPYERYKKDEGNA